WTAANGWTTSDVEYDAMGRAYRANNPYYCGGYAWVGINGPWTTSSFDNLGRVTSVTLADNNTVQTSYAGTVTTVTDQAGKQRRQIADALGRVVRVDEPDSSGSLGSVSSPNQPTSYLYDVLGNLVQVTQAGTNQVTQNRYFKYDSLSRLVYERQVEQAAPYSATDSLT